MELSLSTQGLIKVVGSVLKLATTDTCLPLINSVLLRRQGMYLTATATDRYVLGICRDRLLPESELPPEDWRFLLTLEDAKALLRRARMARKEKLREVHLTTTALKLSYAGCPEFTATNVEVTTGHYPDVDRTLMTLLQSEPMAFAGGAWCMERWGQFVDAQRLGALSRNGSRVSLVWGLRGPRSPCWAVKIGREGDFVGALMGVRLGDGETEQTITDVADWKQMLT